MRTLPTTLAALSLLLVAAGCATGPTANEIARAQVAEERRQQAKDQAAAAASVASAAAAARQDAEVRTLTANTTVCRELWEEALAVSRRQNSTYTPAELNSFARRLVPLSVNADSQIHMLVGDLAINTQFMDLPEAVDATKALLVDLGDRCMELGITE